MIPLNRFMNDTTFDKRKLIDFNSQSLNFLSKKLWMQETGGAYCKKTHAWMLSTQCKFANILKNEYVCLFLFDWIKIKFIEKEFN